MGGSTDRLPFQLRLNRIESCPICGEDLEEDGTCLICNIPLKPFMLAWQTARVKYNEAIRNAKKRDYANALVNIDEVIRIIGTEPELLDIKGLILFGMHEYSLAQGIWKASLEIDPKTSRGAYFISEYYEPLQEFRASYNRALRYCKTRRFNEAIEELLELEFDGVEEQAQASLLLGMAFLGANKNDKAIKVLEKIRLEPYHSKALYLLSKPETRKRRLLRRERRLPLIVTKAWFLGIGGLFIGMILTLIPILISLNSTERIRMEVPKNAAIQKRSEPSKSTSMEESILLNKIDALNARVLWLQFKLNAKRGNYLEAAKLSSQIRLLDLSEAEQAQFYDIREEVFPRAARILSIEADREYKNRNYNVCIEYASQSLAYSSDYPFSPHTYLLVAFSYIGLDNKKQALNLLQKFHTNFPTFGELDKVLYEGYRMATDTRDDKAKDDIISQMRAFCPRSAYLRMMR